MGGIGFGGRTRRAVCLLGAGLLWGCSAYDSGAIDPPMPGGDEHGEDGGQSDAMVAGSGAPRAGSGGARAGNGGGGGGSSGGSSGTRAPAGGSAGDPVIDPVSADCTANPGSTDCPES